MKKKLIITALALTGAAMLGLTACGAKTGSSDLAENTQSGTYHGLTSTEAIYGVGAVTTAKLLFAAEASDAVSLAASEETGGPSEETGGATAEPDYGLPAEGGAGMEKAQDAAEDFNRYFNMLDGFLDKGATTTVVETNNSQSELLAGYAYKLTVTGKDASGDTVSHVAYLNETVLNDREWDDVDGRETTHVHEAQYSLQGLVEMGTAGDGSVIYYYMSGTRNARTETEDGETESTETIVMRASETQNDQNNYVMMNHTVETEAEQGENETESVYTYSIYREGTLAESTRIEFGTEEEHGETETEYSVRFLTGASRGTYEVERETKNGKTWITVEYNIDGDRGKFVIVKENDGTYQYKFSQNGADDRTFRDFDD